ncbi:MAG: cytochrome c oxidase assembly protein [Pseudomonadales bacterium]
MAVHGRVTALKLTGLTVLMFGFGFALVPLYDVFCRITGLNGKVDLTPAQLSQSATERAVKMQFIAVNNEAIPWRFKPASHSMKVALGQSYQTAYLAKNSTANYMVAQAVPSVSPSEAAAYVEKVNCFCFNRQPLNAGESKEMGLVFNVRADLPEHIKTITLSYTLFDITAADHGEQNSRPPG